MAEKISISPDEIWDYFQDNKTDLKTKMHMVAENKDYGISVYITEENLFPQFIVESDGMQIYEERCLNKAACENAADKIYGLYLTEEVFNIIDPDRDEISFITQKEAEEDMEIDYRENELSDAVEDLVDTIIGGEGVTAYYDESQIVIEELKDIVCAYLYLKRGIEPYRPMVIEFADGSESFEEYPYSQLDLSEYEKNPLFKQ